MLLTMKSQIEAMRGFSYVLAADVDIGRHHPDAVERQRRRARVDLLTPVLKGWCTELGVEITSLGVQVHGGMGYIEETGAAQYLRDARIATIYEGTNGIQAADLVGRKLPAQKGAAMAGLVTEMRGVVGAVERVEDEAFSTIARHLAAGVDALEQASEWLLHTLSHDPAAALAGSFNYMMLTGYVCGGWQLARAALIARARNKDDFMQAKITTAAFYAEQILPKAASLLISVRAGASYAGTLPLEQF
jgi:acyl-CoA dehydrogenase